jgi:hypothetical protein
MAVYLSSGNVLLHSGSVATNAACCCGGGPCPCGCASITIEVSVHAVVTREDTGATLMDITDDATHTFVFDNVDDCGVHTAGDTTYCTAGCFTPLTDGEISHGFSAHCSVGTPSGAGRTQLSCCPLGNMCDPITGCGGSEFFLVCESGDQPPGTYSCNASGSFFDVNFGTCDYTVTGNVTITCNT